jgi:hypothetical protein
LADRNEVKSISVAGDGTVGIVGTDYKAYILTSAASANPTTRDELHFNDGESLGLDEIFVESSAKVWVCQNELARIWANYN